MSLKEAYNKYFPNSAQERLHGTVLDAGTSTGKVRTNIGQYSWKQRCEFFDKIIRENGLARELLQNIAGQCGRHISLKASSAKVDDGGNPTVRAKEALRLCDDFNQEVHMQTLAHDTFLGIPKYGSFFWELTSEPSFYARKMERQQLLEPAKIDPVYGVQQWRLVENGIEKVPWDAPEIAHFSWDVTTDTWPFGTSFLTGLDLEFETLAQYETDIKEYLHKTAFPVEIVSLFDPVFQTPDSEMSTVRNRFRNWAPGQKFVVNYPISYTAGGTGDRRIQNLPDIIGFEKEQIVDSLGVAPISSQYNSTEASSKVMRGETAANIYQPLQRIFEVVVQASVYVPLLESYGYSWKLCPTLVWEDPEAAKLEKADYYTKMASVGMPQRLIARENGYEEEWEENQREKQRQQDEMFQKQSSLIDRQKQKEQQQQEPRQTGKKGWLVQEVDGREVDNRFLSEANEEGKWVTINGMHALETNLLGSPRKPASC